MFGPIFENVSDSETDVNFVKFEIDETNRRTPAKFGIRSIPSVLAFKNGELKEARTGLMDEETVEQSGEDVTVIKKYDDASQCVDYYLEQSARRNSAVRKNENYNFPKDEDLARVVCDALCPKSSLWWVGLVVALIVVLTVTVILVIVCYNKRLLCFAGRDFRYTDNFGQE